MKLFQSACAGQLARGPTGVEECDAGSMARGPRASGKREDSRPARPKLKATSPSSTDALGPSCARARRALWSTVWRAALHTPGCRRRRRCLRGRARVDAGLAVPRAPLLGLAAQHTARKSHKYSLRRALGNEVAAAVASNNRGGGERRLKRARALLTPPPQKKSAPQQAHWAVR